jgi:hypothetical protein
VAATLSGLGQRATATFTLIVQVGTSAGPTIVNTAMIATTLPQPTSAGKTATVTITLPHGASTAALVGPLSLTAPAATSWADPGSVRAPAALAVQEVTSVTVPAETSHADWARRTPVALGRKLHLPGDFWSELDERGLL